ncbi:ABC transporter substrate-binding protein [Conexibacter arvalis]|nr:ABC transporter substrate-binding protein [Conexibacter arvalis]
MRKKRLMSLLAVGASGVALAACGGSSDEGGSTGATTGGDGGEPAAAATAIALEGTPSGDAELTIGMITRPDSLDPHKTLLDASLAVLSYTYDHLLAPGPGGRLVPGLAESWEETPRQATFTIREGATCSDGSPVTASTVKRNLDDVKDPKVGSALLGLGVPTADYAVTADDRARTVTIRLDEPNGTLVPSLQLVPIICGRGLRDRAMLETRTSGSGPYELTDTVPGERYVLRRRDDYAWGPEGSLPTAELPRTVTIRVVTNPTTMANLLLAGDLDTAVLDGADAERVSDRGLAMAALPTSVIFSIPNQSSDRPTGDPAVRQALALALPREQLAEVYLDGVGTLADGITTPDIACVDDGVAAALPTGGAEEAQRLLDEAGWRAGSDGIRVKDGRRLSLRAPQPNDFAGFDAGMELIVAALKEVGIEVRPQPMDSGALVAAAFGGDWDLLPGFQIGMNLPSQLVPFFSGPAPDRGQNFTNGANAAFEQAARRAIALAGEESCATWREAEEALLAAGDIVPVVEMPTRYFANDGVGFELSWWGPIPTSLQAAG